MDTSFLIWLFPAGVVLCFLNLRDEHVFVIVYSVMASYFAGVMVRLMLTLTPVICVTAAIALSTLLDTYLDPSVPEPEEEAEVPTETNGTNGEVTHTPTPAAAKKAAAKKEKKKAKSGSGRGIFGFDTRAIVIGNTMFMLFMFVMHCTWVTMTAYSSPSVVLSTRNPDGSQHIIDDFREAYYWLRQNTAEDAVVMSWWDYGYQIAGMADRPTLVDNNTWNNSAYNVTLPHDGGF